MFGGVVVISREGCIEDGVVFDYGWDDISEWDGGVYVYFIDWF